MYILYYFYYRSKLSNIAKDKNPICVDVNNISNV